MSSPRVSIITPCRNAAAFIRATIESVRSQNYPGLEHIVMDGASTDGTQQILREYPGLIWASEPDRGQSDALNKALRRCTGDIIGWLNADDTYQPGSIHGAVDFLAHHPDSGAVYTDINVIDGDGKFVRLIKSEPFSLERLLSVNFVKQPTLFMRKAILDSIGDTREDLHYVMDWELWIRAAARCRFSYLEGQVFANFRICPGTKTAEHGPKFAAERARVLEELLTRSLCPEIPRAAIRRAMKRAKAEVFLAQAFSGPESLKKGPAFRALTLAVFQDPSLGMNPGFWRRSVQRFLS